MRNKQDEDLKKILAQMETLKYRGRTKNKFTEPIKRFEEQFDVYDLHLEKQVPFLRKLFRWFEADESYKSDTYKKANALEIKITAKMKETLSKEEMTLLEQYDDCQQVLLDNQTVQAFLYGYAINIQTKREKHNYKKSRYKKY